LACKIEEKKINDIVSKTFFSNDGDINERVFWPFLNETFPNCEMFWSRFVVPLTKRIQSEIQDPNERIRKRDGVSIDIERMTLLHYSMFLNLVYAHNHLRDFRLSSFEDFYIHLASACDLTEDFLLKVYSLILECSGSKSVILEEINKKEFLELVEKWYEDSYLKDHRKFVEKAKSIEIVLLNKRTVLDEYFVDKDRWKDYKNLSRMIREYRNIIVHDVQIGKIINLNGVQLVPKKEKIQQYKEFADVFAVLKEPTKLKNDFIEMKEQMFLDIEGLQTVLNDLWTKPIKDLARLFFEDKNQILLQKYNLNLV
jgi:hypothetical protein